MFNRYLQDTRVVQEKLLVSHCAPWHKFVVSNLH